MASVITWENNAVFPQTHTHTHWVPPPFAKIFWRGGGGEPGNEVGSTASLVDDLTSIITGGKGKAG